MTIRLLRSFPSVGRMQIISTVLSVWRHYGDREYSLQYCVNNYWVNHGILMTKALHFLQHRTLARSARRQKLLSKKWRIFLSLNKADSVSRPNWRLFINSSLELLHPCVYDPKYRYMRTVLVESAQGCRGHRTPYVNSTGPGMTHARSVFVFRVFSATHAGR